MIITIRQALQARAGLTALKSQPLPARTALGLARLLKALDAELATYLQVEADLIERLGATPVQGRPGEWAFGSTEIRDEFVRELTDLQTQTVELPDVRVRLGDLGKVAADDLMYLDWLLDDSEEVARAESPA